MDRLQSGQALESGQSLTSVNRDQAGWFRLMLFDSGRPVIYRVQTHREVWSAPGVNAGATKLEMRPDGNLVATNASGGVVWSSGTAGHANASAHLHNDGNLVVESSAGAKLWASNSAQDLKSPTIHYVDQTYHFTETSESWKETCGVLPCFKALQWPGYASGIVEDTIDGHPVVIQWWKGWCQKFLGAFGVNTFPGGVGGEVGIYRRMPGRNRPTQLPYLSGPLETAAAAALRALPDNEVWWPYPELGAQVSFTMTNPITNQRFFEARTEQTYWLAKWMDEPSYKRYQASQGTRWGWLPRWFPGNSRTPTDPADFRLEFRVNGKTYPAV